MLPQGLAFSNYGLIVLVFQRNRFDRSVEPIQVFDLRYQLRGEDPDQDGPDEKRKGRIDDHANCDGSGPCNPAHSKPDGLDLPFDFDEAASRVDPSADEKWNR